MRNDYLVTFASKGPNQSGEMPLSALTGEGAANLFDRTVLQFLAQRNPRKQGHELESTTLQIIPEVLLAQAALIAHTYGAMFCVAAHRHFQSRNDIDNSRNASYPALLLGGPLPEHITGSKEVLAMRQPLTYKRDGTKPRDGAIFFGDGSWQTIKVTGPAMPGRVVEG